MISENYLSFIYSLAVNIFTVGKPFYYNLVPDKIYRMKWPNEFRRKVDSLFFLMLSIQHCYSKILFLFLVSVRVLSNLEEILHFERKVCELKRFV